MNWAWKRERETAAIHMIIDILLATLHHFDYIHLIRSHLCEFIWHMNRPVFVRLFVCFIFCDDSGHCNGSWGCLANVSSRVWICMRVFFKYCCCFFIRLWWLHNSRLSLPLSSSGCLSVSFPPALNSVVRTSRKHSRVDGTARYTKPTMELKIRLHSITLCCALKMGATSFYFRF